MANMWKKELSIKRLMEYAIIVVCLLIGSILYATNAGLSRRVVVLIIPILCGLYYVCKKYINVKWHKYIIFSLCYWIIVIPHVNWTFVDGRIAVAGSDAVVQIYPAMLYISRTLREIFGAVFSDATFTFPMWEWSLGMGENTISTLNYYGLGDPFYLFSALISEEMLPYFYTIFYYVRMYLAGIVCIAFFYELDSQKNNNAYVIGALVYSLSGFSYQSNMFVIFVHAMMYTPLLLLGAERVLKERKKGVLLIATFLYGLSGFFFLYITSIAVGIYVIYRLALQRMRMKNAIFKILELLAEYLLGLGCAAFIFIPEVLGFFASDRVSALTLDFSFKSFEEVLTFLFNIFLPQYSRNQTMSICTIAVLCVIWILAAKRIYIQKINIILLFLSMLIPAVSVIMSGGQEYDRWELVVILYWSYLTFIMWDEKDKLTWRQKLLSVLAWVFMIIYGIQRDILVQNEFGYTLICFGVFLGLIILVLPICRRINKKTLGEALFLVLTVCSIYKSWSMVASDWQIAFVRQDNVVKELIEEKEGDFYRIDYEKTFEEPRLGMNISFMLDYPGISQYFSIENKHYIKAFGEWETGKSSFNNQGLDYRTILETLSSVRYFIAHSENNLLIPYGFSEVKSSQDRAWTLYENEYALPLLYSYDRVFEADIYHNVMNGLEKQNVLLQAAVVEEYEGKVPIVSEVRNHLYEGKYTIDSIQDGVIDEGMVTVNSGGEIEITALLKSGCENYISFVGNPSVEIIIDDEYIKYKEPTTLGTVTEDINKKITIRFSSATSFATDDMSILHYDFEKYDEYIAELNDGSITNIIVDTNEIQCKSDVDETKILCIAAPFDRGWTAKIDGVETKIYRMNNMFMGIEVPGGEHNIQLSYITPGLIAGAVVSGIAVIIILIYASKRVKRKMQQHIY